jgi:biopolymer transport protein ExbB/TolQ
MGPKVPAGIIWRKCRARKPALTWGGLLSKVKTHVFRGHLSLEPNGLGAKAGVSGWPVHGRQSGTDFHTGGVFALFFYAGVWVVHRTFPVLTPLSEAFLRSQNLWTVIPMVALFFWSVAFLFLKTMKLRLQKKAMAWAVVPAHPEFVLTEETARAVLERIQGLVDFPGQFLLLNRIERGLSNLHHLGQVSEVSSVLRGQAEDDENALINSYTLIQGFVWAMPVLGFIGTAQGLAFAIGGFSGVLQGQDASLDTIKQSLLQVTGGLATAFGTTLVALVFALIIQIWVAFRQKSELQFLDECNDYCQSHVISKLRLLSGSRSVS